MEEEKINMLSLQYNRQPDVRAAQWPDGRSLGCLVSLYLRAMHAMKERKVINKSDLSYGDNFSVSSVSRPLGQEAID